MRMLSLSCNSTRHACNSFGLCIRVIVNEKPLNLEKTGSSVISVLLLIYALTPEIKTRSDAFLFSYFIS